MMIYIMYDINFPNFCSIIVYIKLNSNLKYKGLVIIAFIKLQLLFFYTCMYIEFI